MDGVSEPNEAIQYGEKSPNITRINSSELRSIVKETYAANWFARLSMLSSSKFVVGSSRVKIPQFRQNVSARANLIINDARTCQSKIAADEKQ